ncbi:hypothetical protein [Rhodobacter sp. CZR27]|uniref:hypothetical protein n=1 Tax=Rhodobacter sp. CZR27 TaxID=2033869 RepID=UPI000BBF0A6D|nr:hypothetical protein [Rhodobacter sp. CZR27]
MPDRLFRAWLLLLLLSAASTAFAELAGAGLLDPRGLAWGGALLLGVTWLKSRTILGAYLRLDQTPAARRVFSGVLFLYLVLLAGLFLAPLA